MKENTTLIQLLLCLYAELSQTVLQKSLYTFQAYMTFFMYSTCFQEEYIKQMSVRLCIDFGSTDKTTKILLDRQTDL